MHVGKEDAAVPVVASGGAAAVCTGVARGGDGEAVLPLFQIEGGFATCLPPGLRNQDLPGWIFHRGDLHGLILRNTPAVDPGAEQIAVGAVMGGVDPETCRFRCRHGGAAEDGAGEVAVSRNLPEEFIQRQQPHAPVGGAEGTRVVGEHRNHEVAVVHDVGGIGDADLFQIGGAGGGAPSLARLAQGGQKHRGENGDDRDHDEKFDKSK